MKLHMKLHKKLTEIGLNRLHVISSGADTKVTKKLKLTFLTELANMGYLITNPDDFTDSVLNEYDMIMEVLAKKRGGDVAYVPLFEGFPNNVPEKNSVFSKRILGLFGNKMGLFENGTKVNGFIIPEWLFDLNEFGAEPLLGRQNEELFKKGLMNQETRKSDKHTEWIELEIVSTNELESRLEKFLLSNLYSKSSIKESLKGDIEVLLDYCGVANINPTSVVFKETQSYVMDKLWELNEFTILSEFIKSPTDILRMFASLTETDVSLSSKIRFPKLNRPQRRFVLENLDKFTNLPESLNAYKGIWLELGRYLHPGEYRKQYPNTFKSFDLLRNGKIITYNSKVESAIRDKEIDLLLELLVKRPGVFGRKIHEILVDFPKDVNLVLSKFSKVSNQLELKNLLVMESYFKTINDSKYRTVINKRGKVIVLPNNKLNKLDGDTLSKLLDIIQHSIKTKLSNNNLLGTKVWIDSKLSSYTVPLQQRKMSEGTISLGRGTRVKFDENKVLRMFMYWKEYSNRTDLDLSLIQFNESMEYVGHVSYTNLSEDGITHSGDITSAPYGAAEFIDIDIEKVSKQTRYVGVQIYRYSGENFTQLEKSYTGWMFRDKADNDHKSFDIKTVKNKLNVTGVGNYSMPLIVDLKTKEIIYIDMYMNGNDHSYNSVESSINDVSTVARELIKMVDSKPNMYDLVLYNMVGSKATIVGDQEDADLTYGVSGCDLNVTDTERILSELL